MSRSIHKTRKGVFGGKSSQEIVAMIVEDDSDAEDIRKKHSYKNKELAKRKEEKNFKNNEY